MAQRRMVSKNIIDSAKFLKMPISSQALYFHLIIRADDDGVVEAYNVMRIIGATEDDLRVLISKEYVRILNEDLVSFILDWLEHNNIRADRKIDSIYQDLLVRVVPNAQILEKKPRSDSKKMISVLDGQHLDGPLTDNGLLRLGKDRLGKVNKDIKKKNENQDICPDKSIDKSTPEIELEKEIEIKKLKHIRHKYGEYSHVLLNDEDLEKLKTRFNDFENRIKRLDEYIEMSGKKYKNHYLTILKWAEKDKPSNNQSVTDLENEIKKIMGDN